MTSAELRSLFLQFFFERGHTIVPSSTLVPSNDPTLLFTNAGMVPFKDVFLGREQCSYVRAASSQRCVRAGGKHNDLENVGYTARHHTFFEMLGNFSFGDYFKRDAIHYAWEFLTRVLHLPTERLWVTVYDQDSEAEDIWLHSVGIDPHRFSRVGAKDNFWSMGETGPCGPCSEIYYDHGEHIPGGPPGHTDMETDRYVEIWNLVFMQYDRAMDGTLVPLPQPSVDTGMGLERLAAVVQGVHSNYETDLLSALVDAAARLAGISDTDNSSLRVLADHIRSCAFLIVDGVTPSNEGRGYVLRRIIRRAIRHGYKLGIRKRFFYALTEPLCEVMGTAYPELIASRSLVERVLEKEEERFAETLDQGMSILESRLGELEGVVPGTLIFQLYDTYGFPVDLTADIAREHGLVPDMTGFEEAMEKQRERARAASHFTTDYVYALPTHVCCEFTGYIRLIEDSLVLHLLQQGKVVDVLGENEEGTLILEKTPFYAESGGQIGDCGKVYTDESVFEVQDTQKYGTDTILLHGRVLKGHFTVGSIARAVVDENTRHATAANHSATHLLHAALRHILGEHVTQKGSLVESNRLRFDFSHFEPIPSQQLENIERLVNQHIRLNQPIHSQCMPKEDAMKIGAMALFGEKYGETVRVLQIGSFSTELCGGTHAERTGDIGLFKIISESGVASGIRRIEALTGEAAYEWVMAGEQVLSTISTRLKAGGRDHIGERVQQLLERQRAVEKELDALKRKYASASGNDLIAGTVCINGLNVLAARIDETEPKALRELVDQLRNKLGSAAIVLATVKDGKVSLIAGVTKDQITRVKAGDLVNAVAVQVGGKGGGRPDLAQAGGTDPSKLDAALKTVPEWIRQQIPG